jgi:bifunctional N-acetylglucosamine-1-phosphate-uridyltransferase/glucosamine-1-phosphate-acetyltransferase GlmU-like protein
MDRVQVAHFNYVGDSILGSGTHLAAGAILSNLRFDQRSVMIKVWKEKLPTELQKLGAILGEGVQIGCNSVLFPGTLLGKGSIISAGTTFGGVLGENKMIYCEAKNILRERESWE